ncbi:isochorismatase [Corynebacterium sp. 13CS0277]|uniref:phosphopantetheine-binding protein n=1 Tax=Corynebacterium sp. 13CS0277 TaxID=2071994 RepID=UPI000D02EC44|nr:phosphopantetheine-binding protein [Corynebacterium sp. 13CS0277]PRQ12382.1 isochorismatase [Corynebacterium sp. 13CS0277]
MTPHELRSSVTSILGVDDIDPTIPLTDQGLDSVRLITLVETWREQGTEVDFFTIASLPTLNDWEALICGGQS